MSLYGKLVFFGFVGLIIFILSFILTDTSWNEGLRKKEEDEYLSHYQPSPQIKALARATTLTEYSQRLLYLNHPDILPNKNVLIEKCGQAYHHRVIRLGCYQKGRGIYILNMSSSLFEGLMESTLAHELLHAEYERLSSNERDQVDQLLLKVRNGSHKKKIKDRLNSYYGANESDLNNELHSIVGTEIKRLPLELEKHYSKYFTSREKVVYLFNLHDTKLKEFDQKINFYDQSLRIFKKTIRNQQENISTLQNEIDKSKKQIHAIQKIQSHKTAYEYNILVKKANQKIYEHRHLMEEHKRMFQEYNDMIQNRNKAVENQRKLFKKIGFQ